MRLHQPVTLLKEKMQNAAGLIALILKAIKCPIGQRHPDTFIEQCNMQDEIQAQPQIQTFPSRITIVRPENSECYTLINSQKSRIKKDYLGQAILKTQFKVVTGPYW